MNIVTAHELSGDGAPLLRTGGGEQEEEFLIKAFSNVGLHLSEQEADPSLPASSVSGQLFVTTRYVPLTIGW